jgi:glycerol dehydrogenase
LCLDDEKAADEVYAIVDFEIAVGLPVTFADINIEGIARPRLKTIGDAAAAEGSICHNHPFKVTSETIVDAMIVADALGRERKRM